MYKKAPSISSSLEQVEEKQRLALQAREQAKEAAAAKPVSDAEVTQQLLVRAWESLTEKLADEVSGVAAHLLKNTVPEFTAPHTIKVGLANPTLQQAAIEEVKHHFLPQLREELQNSHLQIESYMGSGKVGPAVSRKPYTEQERYDYLLELNPNLQLLQETFKLDFR